MTHSILSLNAEAIGNMSRGSFIEASRLLRSAVTHLLVCVEESDDPLQSLIQKDQEALRNGLCVTPLPIEHISDSRFTSRCTLDDGGICLFDRVLGLVPFHELDSDTIVHDRMTVLGSFSELVAVLIYNFGLLLHIQALLDAKLESVYASKATKLYNLAGEVLRRETDSDIFLQLVLTNNLLHLYTCQFNHKGIDQCRSGLQLALQSTQVRHEIHHYAHFSFNATIASFFHRRTAGAA